MLQNPLMAENHLVVSAVSLSNKCRPTKSNQRPVSVRLGNIKDVDVGA
jgi:hypothetical protein